MPPTASPKWKLDTSESRVRLGCLELFSGIGGFAVAARRLGWCVVESWDIHQPAGAVYRQNFEFPHRTRTIESIPLQEFAAVEADFWWLSPPCQPFTRRGACRGIDDPRCEALRRTLSAIATVRPDHLVLENVPGFADSTAAELLRQTLADCEYSLMEVELCPTQFGIPNRRKRFYMLASRSMALEAPGLPQISETQCPIRHFLSSEFSPELVVCESEIHRFRTAIDVVDPDDPQAVASCFTSAYGKSPVQSGSYLPIGGKQECVESRPLRRFSPREILRLLGFPESFRFPVSMTLRQRWKLAGNSLSIPVVEYCLQHFRNQRV